MTDLPPGWVETTLGEIADTSLGKMLDRGKATGTHLVPYLRNVNVQWGRIDLEDVLTMDITPGEQDFFRLREGDLLVCEGGEIGRCAIWVGGAENMAFQKALHRVRPYGGIDPRYLRYCLEYMSVSGALFPFATGSTIKHLPQQQLRRLPLRLPPLAEQRRIVASLEDHLSRLDAGGAQVQKAVRRATSFRGLIFDACVQGRFGDGVNDDVDSSLAELLGSGKKIDYHSLPSLPPGWRWRIAEDVCEQIVCGGTPKSDLMYRDFGDVPFLKVYNLARDGRVDFSIRPTFIDSSTHEGLLKRSRVRSGDVVTNIVGPPLGKTAIIPDSYSEWNINQAIVAFRAGVEMLPSWLALALQAPSILEMLRRTARATAGQFNIALSTCRELPLPVPPIETQQSLVEEVEELLYGVTRTTGLIHQVSTRSKKLRNALLAEAFSGRLARQNPDDEPASLLMERIRAERGAVHMRGRRTHRGSTGGGPTRKTPPQKETLL
jgi:type I restriction enzyme S subunit